MRPFSIDFTMESDSKMKFRKIMKESAEKELREQYKDILDKVERICKKHNARTKNVYMDTYGNLNIVFAVDDDDRTPGVGFNMNAIMGAGYGIKKDLKKAGIYASVGAGGYVGNSSKITIFTSLLDDVDDRGKKRMLSERAYGPATEKEADLVEKIADCLYDNDFSDVDFADNGYEIYLTDEDGDHFTISVVQED